MSEFWRSIAGYEGAYEVSNLGRVRSVARTIHHEADSRQRTLRGVVLKPGAEGSGRLFVCLSRGGRVVAHKIHRLVAQEFVPGYRVGLEALHEDGNHLNNRSMNLYWGTPSDNAYDRVRHGSDAKAGPGKIREAQLRYAFARDNRMNTQEQLALDALER